MLLSAFFFFSFLPPLSMLELYLLSIQTAQLNAQTLFDLPPFHEKLSFKKIDKENHCRDPRLGHSLENNLQ